MALVKEVRMSTLAFQSLKQLKGLKACHSMQIVNDGTIMTNGGFSCIRRTGQWVTVFLTPQTSLECSPLGDCFNVRHSGTRYAWKGVDPDTVQ
jgi:hypothetical protein